MVRSLLPVGVLGGGLTGLGVVRTLGRRGLDIYLAVDRKDQVIFSRYCKESYIVPELRFNQTALKKFLVRIGRRTSKRVVIYPTSDLDALNLSVLKEDLKDDYCFVVGNKEPVELLVNKTKFYKALDRNKISHPTTYFIDDEKDIKQIEGKINYPVFMKPSITQLFNRTFGDHGKGFVANSLKELVTYHRLATRYGIKVMLQEIIPGPPSNSYQLEGYYNENHRPIVLFARQRLRIWPPNFGNTTVCTSIPLEKLADEKKMVNKFLRAIGYQGLMSAEFKRDSRDNKLKFLEINARAWWHFWLSTRCGADIIFVSYLDAIGEEAKYTEEYETGVKSIYLLLDLVTSAKMFLDGDLSLQNWISSMYGKTEFAFLHRDDLKPFIMNFTANITQLINHGVKIFRRDFKVS
jgi:predicted ATP-grasp superfamily ATP-dependent carboligase